MVFWRSVQSSEPSLGKVAFALRRCVACGTAVTVGDARLGGDLHEQGAYAPGPPRLERTFNLIVGRRFLARRLRLLAPGWGPRDGVAGAPGPARLVDGVADAPPPPRLLDAGAGRGRFVAAARAAGYDATGIEPSTRGITAAEAIGAPVERTSIDEARVELGSFDVVTLWHVLEHVDDPAAALDRIATWLRPGGALLVGVPNLASLQARLAGPRWYHLDVPRHRTHFTERGLHTLLRHHEFQIVRTTHLLLEHNPFGMWQSLVNRLTEHPSYLYNLLKRNAPVRSRDLLITAVAVPLAPVAGALELLAGLAGRGGTIAVLARRE
jgi:SAM-dependent methyltransferase